MEVRCQGLVRFTGGPVYEQLVSSESSEGTQERKIFLARGVHPCRAFGWVITAKD